MLCFCVPDKAWDGAAKTKRLAPRACQSQQKLQGEDSRGLMHNYLWSGLTSACFGYRVRGIAIGLARLLDRKQNAFVKWQRKCRMRLARHPHTKLIVADADSRGIVVVVGRISVVTYTHQSQTTSRHCTGEVVK